MSSFTIMLKLQQSCRESLLRENPPKGIAAARVLPNVFFFFFFIIGNYVSIFTHEQIFAQQQSAEI